MTLLIKKEFMAMKRTWLILMISVGVLFCSFSALAAEEKESNVAKAADQIIEGLPGALKAGVDFSKMTPEQRINWLLNSVEEKAISSVTEKMQDAVKEKMEAYAKEAIRAKAFMDIGVPQIKNAYALGKPFDWAKIDAEIASKADTNFNKLNAGIKAAQISWATIQAYRQGDFASAARTLGGEIGGLLAEAYIPGYAYIKVGAAMVELLGNYILDYATDTAIEGMLNDMYGMKSNPQGLAQWLIDKSPDAIMKDINDKFNDGMGFGYVFRGQGTDKGDEEMKNRLQKELVSLRSQLVLQQKEAQRREQQAQAEIEKYLQKYKESEKALKDEAAKVKAEVDKELAPVKEFKKKISALSKQDVNETIAEIKKQEGDIGSAEGVPYVPFNYGSLISELTNVYSEIKETANGYDYNATTTKWSAYLKRRAEMLKQVSEANQQNCRNAQKEVDAQYQPRLRSLWDQYQSAKDGRTKESLMAQYNVLRDEFSAAHMRKSAGCGANGKRLNLEVATFKQEEEIVALDAQERASRLSASIQQGIEKIIDGIKQSYLEYDAAKKAWVSEVQQSLSYPNFFLNPGGYDQATAGSSVSGIVREIKNGKLQVYSPGELHQSRERTIEAIEKIKQDQTLISGLTAKERAVVVSHQKNILQLKSEFESLVPENLRGQGASRTPEMDDYQKTEDERVTKYGSASASKESWQITHPPFVRFDPFPQIPPVDNPRYFDKTLAELETLAQARREKFKAAQKVWEEDLQTIDFYADLDRIAVSIMSLNNRINSVLGRFLGVYPNFRVKDGKDSILNKAEESDGAKTLKDMKEAWESVKPYVERMRKNVTAYGKGIKYLSSTNNPSDAIKRLPYYEAVPGQIEAAEKRMAETEKQRLMTLKTIEDEIAKLKADIESLKDPDKAAFYPITLRQLRSTFDQIFRILAIDTARRDFKEEYELLRAQMEENIKEHDARVKQQTEEYKRKLAAEEAARKAAEEAKNREAMKQYDPAGYYGYRVLSARVNTYPVDNASGQVIVTRDKLIQGEIQISAQLNHVDHVKTMLFSEDGGRVWKEIPKGVNIQYAFSPILNKMYDPFLQIRTDDFLTVNLKLIPNADGLIYKDEDFNQQVINAIMAIAEAYERQDIGGFSDLISRDYAGEKTFLVEGVRFDFDMFLDISLRIYINRIQNQGMTSIVETKWDKSQTPRKTGQTQKTTGKTTVVLAQEDGRLKIQNLRGDLLYATLSPEIAQASGLSSSKVEQIRVARDERNPVQPGAGRTDDPGGLDSPASETQTLTVTSPNGGEVWSRGSTYNITWTSSGIDDVLIEYYEEGDWWEITPSTSAAAGSYPWTIDPMIPGGEPNARVRITAVDDPSITDTSDNTFSIIP